MERSLKRKRSGSIGEEEEYPSRKKPALEIPPITDLPTSKSLDQLIQQQQENREVAKQIFGDIVSTIEKNLADIEKELMKTIDSLFQKYTVEIRAIINNAAAEQYHHGHPQHQKEQEEEDTSTSGSKK